MMTEIDIFGGGGGVIKKEGTVASEQTITLDKPAKVLVMDDGTNMFFWSVLIPDYFYYANKSTKTTATAVQVQASGNVRIQSISADYKTFVLKFGTTASYTFYCED